MQSTVSVPVATSAPACLNCGATPTGEFCHACGQRVTEGRLTLRTAVLEFVERSLSLERGLLRTFVEMCTDPGGVVRRYADGQRRRYVSPLAYMLIGAAVLLLGYELYEAQLRAWMEASLATAFGEMNRGMRGGGQPVAGLSTDQVRLLTATMISLSKKATLTSAAMALPFAALLRLFFRRSGVNFAEATAFTLYCFGHIFVLAGVMTPIAIFSGAGVATVTQWSLLLYAVVPGFAALGFFGRSVGAVAKTLVAMALAYGVFTVALWIGVVLYVLQLS